MSDTATVILKVDNALRENSIVPMNELLVTLSEDASLSREFRYAQQQRLRTAIAQHGHRHKEDAENETAEREQALKRGGQIL